MGRIILIIIDSLGIGAMEDVENSRIGDIGANTIKNIIRASKGLKIPNLCRLGIMNSLGEEIRNFKYSKNATYGVANLGYKGADSYLGHMEMFGYDLSKIQISPISKSIEDIRSVLTNLGHKVCMVDICKVKGKGEFCNYEATKIDNKSSNEFCHSKGYIIVDDCVFIGDNIEAEAGTVYSVIGYNKDISFNNVKDIAKEVRKIVKVPRIVAVSTDLSMKEIEGYIESDGTYIGINSERCNLYNRDYKVEHMPYRIHNKGTICEYLNKSNINTTLIGKVADIIPEDNFKKLNLLRNKEIFQALKEEIYNGKSRFIAVNFQECDLSGHLSSVNSYVDKLNEIDSYIGWIIKNINDDDVVMVTADHGNDPTIGHRYHTREKVPILIHNFPSHEKFIGEFLNLEVVGKCIKHMGKINRT